MATTKATASAHVRLLLLLAAILLVVASIQARGDSMTPPPAMAPTSNGQCPSNKVAELRECFESSPLGGVRLPRTLDGLTRCCGRVTPDESIPRGGFGSIPGGGFGYIPPTPSADTVECLCSAFSNSSDPSLINNDVNTVLAICGQAPVTGLTCSSTRSVTVRLSGDSH